MDLGLAAQLAGFREARAELEASILPLATSVDGRRFSFQASLYRLTLQAGGYVVLEGGGSARLGHLPPGRGPDRREDLAPARAAALRGADQRGGRRRCARHVGPPRLIRARTPTRAAG